MYIYKITNKINGKVYVGQTTKSVERRFYFHCKNKNCGSKLTNAINKYGKDNFSVELLETCASIQELDEKEIYWIKELNTITDGYNIQTGGYIRDSMRGKKHSEETKLKMKLAATGRKLDKETLAKLRKPKSQEHNIKNGKAHSKPVVCVETGEVFSSGRNAAKHFNISEQGINKVVRGISKRAAGYSFKYVEVDNG